MNETTGREARVEEMRTRLLDAAEGLYAAEGSAALTNRRISAAGDTTTQSIYTYFGSRDELITAMYRRAVNGARALLALAIEQGQSRRGPAVDPSDFDPATVEAATGAFGDWARAYRAYCAQYPGRFRLLRAAGGDPALPVEAAQLREQLVDALIGLRRAGGHRPDPGDEGRVRLTLSAINGFVLAELESFVRPEHDADGLFEDLVVRCLSGRDR